AARRLQPLVGERVEVETPHPRAAVERIGERLNGRRLESVEARGKNLLLTFEGGRVLRSHLRMSGRWRVQERGRGFRGTPWLVLRSAGQGHAERLMRASLAGPAPKRVVYRRAGRPCARCGTAIRSRGQGDANRIAYWCPGCQRGDAPGAA